MSYDGGRDPLDITQVIEFVPDNSGEVSDREFDPDDLLPNVEEEQVLEYSGNVQNGHVPQALQEGVFEPRIQGKYREGIDCPLW